ncbi:MAG: hypothetical protein M1415_03025, partial [Firmicutes bacterium]|nr:hypothetical protein [Bacillota bacterium]
RIQVYPHPMGRSAPGSPFIQRGRSPDSGRTIDVFRRRYDYDLGGGPVHFRHAKRGCLGLPRVLYALALHRSLPAPLAKVLPTFHTPRVAIWTTGILVA